MALEIVLGVAGGLLLCWLALVVVLWVRRPDDATIGESLRLLPDVLRLVRRLAADATLPRRVRWSLWALLAYLLSPIDLVPDVIPVLGYADDAVIVVLALRFVTRRAGDDALDRHWPGSPAGLAAVRQLVPDAKPVRPLFITAGSGVTPVMSMLRTYDVVGNVPDIVHVHYAPHEYDAIFGSELRDLAEKYPKHYSYHPIHTRDLSGGGDADPREDRHFSTEQLAELCPDWRGRHVWACGPQGLLEDIAALYEAEGRARQVHVERFRAALADLEDAEGGQVTFVDAGDEVASAEADGETPLLRIAEDAGLNPAHGCRMGICHTCDTPLLGGRVRDLRSGAVISEEGHMVQTCVSAAAGDCRVQLRT